MRIILDGRSLRLYPLGKEGFAGGTETYLKVIARGLADKGHTVHVLTPDLDREEQRGPTEWWWSLRGFPTDADVVACWHNLEGITTASFNAPILICATNGIDPFVGPNNELVPSVDGWPVFSETHKTMLCATRNIDPAKCFVTGLGIALDNYSIDWLGYGGKHPLEKYRVPGRLLYANDPARGLWHLLDTYDHLKKLVPHASLHVAYDFDKQFEAHRWNATAMAETLWVCKKRLQLTPDVRNLGALTRSELIREQLECHVHAMPSDPPNAGSQIHGILQMECAAAGAPLVLSDTEAFPEVFGAAATILPLPGTYLPDHERRYDAQDWAEVIAELMGDPEKWDEASRASRALAEQNTWQHVVDRWQAMLDRLALAALGSTVGELVKVTA